MHFIIAKKPAYRATTFRTFLPMGQHQGREGHQPASPKQSYFAWGCFLFWARCLRSSPSRLGRPGRWRQGPGVWLKARRQGRGLGKPPDKRSQSGRQFNTCAKDASRDSWLARRNTQVIPDIHIHVFRNAETAIRRSVVRFCRPLQLPIANLPVPARNCSLV